MSDWLTTAKDLYSKEDYGACLELLSKHTVKGKLYVLSPLAVVFPIALVLTYLVFAKDYVMQKTINILTIDVLGFGIIGILLLWVFCDLPFFEKLGCKLLLKQK